MQLLPGILLMAMALIYLLSEVLLRRRTGWAKGPLNYGTKPVVLLPLAVYIVAAVILSTASWNILNLTSMLIVFALPMALGASYRGFRPDTPLATPAIIAVGLSLLGLTFVGLGYQA
ncbi:MAG: hypothetical protein WBG36_04380 [Ornithinimicrobium sp.]